MTLCAVPDCGKTPVTKGYCKKHYARVWRNGSPELKQPKSVPRQMICAVEGCYRAHSCCGYCKVHYTRIRRHGDPEVVLFSRHGAPERFCAVSGCGRKHSCKGYCEAHYKRFAAGKQVRTLIGVRPSKPECKKRTPPAAPTPPALEKPKRIRTRRVIRFCGVDGCGSQVKVNGLCGRHREPDTPTGPRTLSPEDQRAIYKSWCDHRAGRSGFTLAQIAAAWGITPALLDRVVLTVQTSFIVKPLAVQI